MGKKINHSSLFKSRRNKWIALSIIACGGFSAEPVYAIATGDSTKVTFSGMLKIHPCHISNDRDLSVHFDNVGINKVESGRYKQAIPYELTCEQYDPSWRLTLQVKGAVSSFDNRALGTNIGGLGIQIQQNGQPMNINSPLNINYGAPPVLDAVLVKDPSVAKLKDGTFSTTVTLLAEYL